MMEANTVDTPMNDNRAGDHAGRASSAPTQNTDNHRGIDRNDLQRVTTNNVNYAQKSGGTMPTQPRDTWRDWFADADQVPQVTRDELVDLIAPRLQPGEAVASTTLRYWENHGVMPPPVRRWHDGATRALYPKPYAAMAVFTVLAMQARGYTLPEIKAQIVGRLKAQYIDYDVLEKWKSHALKVASEFTDATGTAAQKVELVVIDSDGLEHIYGFEIEE